MRPFWKGFLSIFDAMGDLFTFGSSSRFDKRIREIEQQSKARESWYHRGPWWEHPLWGDTWKDKDAKRKARRR